MYLILEMKFIKISNDLTVCLSFPLGLFSSCLLITVELDYSA